MNESSRPVVVIACKIFEILLQQYLPEMMVEQATWLDYGLHRVPSKIATSVQAELDRLPRPSLVVLGYGLCGNGISGIQAGPHTLLVPRMDDCITLLLGSYSRYMQEFESVPGTYWLSRGWLESGSHPLKEYEEYRQRYGEKDADWLVDTQYEHYERLVMVAHDRRDLDAYRAQAQAVARFCERWGMQYEEILGSDDYVRRLVQVAQDLNRADSDFVIIPPGGEIRMEQFLR